MDCDSISGFTKYAGHSTETLKEERNIAKEIEIRFNKNLKPNVSIIPNPNSGIFTVEIYNDENSLSVISIKSPLGNELKKFNITESKISLDLHNLAKGIYFVEVIIENNRIIKKLIIN